MTTDKNKEKTCVKDAFNILNEVKYLIIKIQLIIEGYRKLLS